ncbi:MAG: xanthine dehydrogenase family protein molybdopterin-binding subunit [Proteobacteria bacterium]|nr:xanthine dehydrogenase family protein molybdopterin-binding subunit [Pseudomonadota bacterium]
MAGEYGIGQSVPRYEDPRLLRGRGRYVSDMVMVNMAHGHVLRSPHAHAKILSIDTSAAKAVPGVLAVYTGEDWKNSGYGDLPNGGSAKKRDGSPMYTPPYPALVSDRVRRVGDYVAFVVAHSVNEAMDAAELIEVEYEPLPAGTSTAAAYEGSAPAVWDDNPDNICYNHQEGDKAAADAAFEKAEHIVRQTFTINRVSANSMETRGCIGTYDTYDDSFTIYTTLQGIPVYRATLAKRVLRVPEHKVRVIAGDVGGGFGMKSAIYNEVALVLWAAKALERPVKWISTRSEALLSDAHGRDYVTFGELALNKNGKFVGMRVQTTAAIGAYLMGGVETAAVKNLGTLAGVYTTPAIHLDVSGVFSNTNPVRAYRGNGRPENAYILERLIDIAADELDIDPVEIRRRNIIPPEAMPYQTPLTFNYDCGEFEKGMDMAVELAEYKGAEKRRAEAKARGKLFGIGISNSIERAASGLVEGGEVNFNRNGTVTIASSSLNQGQGHETMYNQIICDRLGLNPEDIRYVQGDSDRIPYGQGSGGSRSAALGGSAMHNAALKIIEKATKIAAHMMEASEGDIEFKDGVFTVAGTNITRTIQEVAITAHDPTKMPNELETGLTATAIFTPIAQNYPNGTHIVELEIDEETGVINLTKYSVVDDVGTVLNPLTLKGQIQGGIGQGIGQVLFENIEYDEDGQLVTGSFMDYCMPRADDMVQIEIESNPVPTETNPLGIKGAGEAGTVGALPAVANAIMDALSVFGIKHIDMPATPERVWRAIQEAKAG